MRTFAAVTGFLSLLIVVPPASAQEERPIQLALVNPVQLFPEADAVREALQKRYSCCDIERYRE